MAGTNPILGGGGFHHVAIKVSDFDRTVRMYTEAFGFAEKIRWGEGHGRAVMLDTGDGNYLEVFAGGTARTAVSDTASDGPIIHFALRTSKIDEVIARAKKAGFKVTIEPKDVNIPSTPGPTPVRLAFCTGPDGEVFEFFQNTAT